jgi:protein-glutamine gamma-glutamyltransferase
MTDATITLGEAAGRRGRMGTNWGEGVRLAAFAGLVAFVAWRYVSIEARPPAGRVVMICAAAVTAAAVISLLEPPAAARSRTRALIAVAQIVVLLALFAATLVAAGAPPHLLTPAGWARLAAGVKRGTDPLATTLWPFSGNSSWARRDLMLALATIMTAASALAFWPARRFPPLKTARQVAALALLLGLYVIGVVDGSGSSVTLEGPLLLALVVAWLWLPGLRAGRVLAMLAWLAVAGTFAVVLVGQVASSRAWLDYRAWGLLGPGPGTAFTWDQTYGPISWSRAGRVMFTVRASTPQLWKTTTLDRFDGVRFVRSGTDAAAYQDLPTPTYGDWYAFATFTIRGLSSDLLPSAQGTTAGVNGPSSLRHEPDGTTRTSGPALRSGATYTVLSYEPSPTPRELRAAPRTFPRAYLRYTDFDLPAPSQSGLDIAATDPPTPGKFFTGRTLGAPAPGLPPAAASGMQRLIVASPYGPMYRLSRRLASGRRSAYDVALSIKRYLMANDSYGERPPTRRYPLESFLFTDRIGYCQQFSGAMTLMLRMNGIPARVAAGFLPGTYDPRSSTFQVRAVDAHSWVEVYFSGIGWVPFNPTPPRSLTPATPSGPAFASERSATLADALAATIGAPARRSPVLGAPTRRRPQPRSASSAQLALGALAVGLLALIAIVGRLLAGHVRLRRSLRRDAELATTELVHALRRLGYSFPATVTLAQVERLVRLHGGADAARYVQLLRERRYAPGAVASATLRDRRRFRRALTVHLGLDARLRGLWALPPATVGWRVG